MRKITLIHVDDDPIMIQYVKQVVKGDDRWEYLEGFTDPKEALEYINENTVDIAITDIEMPQMNGIEFAKQVSTTDTGIVFLTSHSGYALQAFEACALDYLVKPITHTMMDNLWERLKTRTNKQNITLQEQANELMHNYLGKEETPKRIFINAVGKIIILNLSNVIYFESQGSYTKIQMIEGEKHMVSKNIKTYAEALTNHPDFLRIHRSYFVNKGYVKSIVRNKHKAAIIMTDGSELEMSSSRKDELLKDLMR